MTCTTSLCDYGIVQTIDCSLSTKALCCPFQQGLWNLLDSALPLHSHTPRTQLFFGAEIRLVFTTLPKSRSVSYYTLRKSQITYLDFRVVARNDYIVCIRSTYPFLMVFQGLFNTKISPKKKDSDKIPREKGRSTRSSSRSPTKKSPSKTVKDRETRPSSAHSNRSYSRPHLSPRQTFSADTHPLNLPPEERERRRSALTNMSDPPTPMDVDQEDSVPASPSSPSSNTPGAFSNPNESNHINGVNGDAGPVPPPHLVSTDVSPQPKPMIDAEACKVAGNKFFKMKDYDKAIREYSKGSEVHSRLSQFY